MHLSGVAHAYAIKKVIEDIDLELPTGRVLALVGPSGCGKTTLLHLAAGLLTLRTGTLDNSFRNPAVMFQQPRLLPWKTTRDNIALGLKAAGLAQAECSRRAREMGHSVGLDDEALRHFPHALSGGMQSRAALARALVIEPDLLLMDEPFSALDIGLKAQLHRQLLDHQAERGLAVLMITHDLMEAVRLADHILVMASNPGRIAHRIELTVPALRRDDGFVHRTTAELLQSATVRACFGLDALPEITPVAAADIASRIVDIGSAAPRGKKGFSC